MDAFLARLWIERDQLMTAGMPREMPPAAPRAAPARVTPKARGGQKRAASPGPDCEVVEIPGATKTPTPSVSARSGGGSKKQKVPPGGLESLVWSDVYLLAADILIPYAVIKPPACPANTADVGAVYEWLAYLHGLAAEGIRRSEDVGVCVLLGRPDFIRDSECPPGAHPRAAVKIYRFYVEGVR